jgi:hypothetical protein
VRQFVLWHLFVWSVRVGVLLGATLTMSHLVNEELGYRMEFYPMLVAAVLMIVTVRLWMPWVPPRRDDT